ncbi:MAG TPA: SRPBCC family protein [bacterium]|nr:SRPBCC family protein [bacterium]
MEAQRLIRASREHVFAHVAHPEHLPRYGAPLWLSADVEDRRGGEPLLALRGYFAGLPVEAVVRTAARAPHSIEIVQVRGTLRSLSLRLTAEQSDDGTVLRCRVDVDAGIPMLSDEAARHFLVQHVERMLDRLRLAAERRPPQRRPVRPSAKAAEAADGTPEGGDAAPDEIPSGPDAVPPDGGPQEAPADATAFSPEAVRARRPSSFSRARAPKAAARQIATPPPVGGQAEAATPGSPGSGRRRRRRRRRGRGTSGRGDAGAGATPDGAPDA